MCAGKEGTVQQYNNSKGLGNRGFFSFISFSKVSVLMERWSEIHGISNVHERACELSTAVLGPSKNIILRFDHLHRKSTSYPFEKEKKSKNMPRTGSRKEGQQQHNTHDLLCSTGWVFCFGVISRGENVSGFHKAKRNFDSRTMTIVSSSLLSFCLILCITVTTATLQP